MFSLIRYCTPRLLTWSNLPFWCYFPFDIELLVWQGQTLQLISPACQGGEGNNDIYDRRDDLVWIRLQGLLGRGRVGHGRGCGHIVAGKPAEQSGTNVINVLRSQFRLISSLFPPPGAQVYKTFFVVTCEHLAGLSSIVANIREDWIGRQGTNILVSFVPFVGYGEKWYKSWPRFM